MHCKKNEIDQSAMVEISNLPRGSLLNTFCTHFGCMYFGIRYNYLSIFRTKSQYSLCIESPTKQSQKFTYCQVRNL